MDSCPESGASACCSRNSAAADGSFCDWLKIETVFAIGLALAALRWGIVLRKSVLEGGVSETESPFAAGLRKFRPGFLEGFAEFGGVGDERAAEFASAEVEADLDRLAVTDRNFQLDLGFPGLPKFFQLGSQIFQNRGGRLIGLNCDRRG